MGEGKQVKILCVGRKGYEQLRRLYGKQIVEVIDLRGVRIMASSTRRRSPRRSSRCSSRASSMSAPCSSRASSR